MSFYIYKNSVFGGSSAEGVEIRTFPEPTPWNGDDTQPMPSVQSPEDEERIERDWADFEAHARDFVKAHGLGAMLRCLSRSVEQQQELLRK